MINDVTNLGKQKNMWQIEFIWDYFPWSYDKWVDKLGLPENFSIVNVTPWDQDIKWTGEGMLGEKNYMTKADYCLLVITIFLLQSIVWYSQTL